MSSRGQPWFLCEHRVIWGNRSLCKRRMKCVCVCVCVCVCESVSERARARDTECLCVCFVACVRAFSVCLCASVYVCVLASCLFPCSGFEPETYWDRMQLFQE